jgi:hypothetical protein
MMTPDQYVRRIFDDVDLSVLPEDTRETLYCLMTFALCDAMQMTRDEVLKRVSAQISEPLREEISGSLKRVMAEEIPWFDSLLAQRRCRAT